MKRFLLFGILLMSSLIINAQFTQVSFENFTSTPINSIPSGWTVSSNTKVQPYSRPNPCQDDKGLLTPGVGKNAPMGVILPSASYDASNPYIKLSFNIYVFSANSQTGCAPVIQFNCNPTLVKAFLVKSSYSGTETDIPAAGDIYAELPSYQLVYANANNTIIFDQTSIKQPISDGATYRILLNFKSADNAECGKGNAKFVLDDFEVSETSCVDGKCPPVANHDYFNANYQTFTNLNQVKGNVYGGYSLWSSQAPLGFALNSLEDAPAMNSGEDYDANNHNLSEMTFTLVSGPIVEASSGCSGSANPGILTFNTNGTFTYDRGTGNGCVTRVSFQYQITDPTGLTSNIAKVTIEFQGNAPLPVSFRSFTVARNKTNVALKWETASEQNNRGFYIQRNTKGVWENIAFVFSASEDGNSNSLLTYTYNDLNTNKGVSQYRIQQVDLDGKVKYSDIRSVRGEEQSSNTLVYPNPSLDGKVNVVFEDQSLKHVLVSDMSGRIIRKYQSVVNTLQVDNLETGVYTIQITDLSSAIITTEKVLIKKR